jgi:hypothetical protein
MQVMLAVHGLVPTQKNCLAAPSVYGEKRMETKGNRNVVFDEVNLMLAEKRTALSLLRTGIAIFSIPLSLGSILIATSNLYYPNKILFLMIQDLGGCSLLVLISLWLIVTVIKKLRSNNKRFDLIIQNNEFLRNLVDP